MNCEFCKTEMTKVDVMNSGNAKYVEYLCKKCNERKTVCEGVN